MINRAYRLLVRFVAPLLGLGFFAHAAVARADDPIGDVFVLDVLVALACALFVFGWVYGRVEQAAERRRVEQAIERRRAERAERPTADRT
jgi:hypothetical protein